MAKRPEGIPFENSNLYLYGWGRDINGNTTIKIGFPNRRAFTIQTNAGQLQSSHRLRGTRISKLDQSEINKIEEEVVAYVQEFGSKEQKSLLKKYGSEKETFAGGGEVKNNEMSDTNKEIEKLEATLKSKFTPEGLKPRLQAKIDALKAKQAEEVESSKKETPAPDKSKKEPNPKLKNGAHADKGRERFAIAKKIWKKGKESWADAVRRASTLQKAGKTGDEPVKVAKKVKKSPKKADPKPVAKKKIKKSPRAKKDDKPAYKPKKVNKKYKLKGTTDKSLDKKRKALKAGWRKSKQTGDWYYEDRANRADSDKRKKL